jgi:hypothetical protein
MTDAISRAAVLALLRELLDKAQDVDAEVGESPTAQEALDWAIGEVESLPAVKAGESI